MQIPQRVVQTFTACVATARQLRKATKSLRCLAILILAFGVIGGCPETPQQAPSADTVKTQAAAEKILADAARSCAS